jgi:mannose-6-phosphate isomerase-like protein (cupin superfamily)
MTRYWHDSNINDVNTQLFSRRIISNNRSAPQGQRDEVRNPSLINYAKRRDSSVSFSAPLPDFNLLRRCDSLTNKIARKQTTMSHFINWHDFEGTQAEKFYKNTLWQGDHLMLGLNCLEPNQGQPVHAHTGADKFYFVLAGRGYFTVGEEQRTVEAGSLVVAPAGIPHGVTNDGTERLSLLVTIAPGVK